MEQIKSRYKVEPRYITVKTTDGDTISGYVNIGIKERVSDLFTKAATQFIVLYDAEHKGASAKVLFINKNHIIWAEPEDN
ncbi:conserved hypothetical protein [uncultured Desulfobacterium sp.]|uniref:Uncharacterized protein n=1 Tax=uncultured Desulfobacterium sp. TaxID=201089 RepID=A0A445N3K0_9BACT|nr:conserved hypothetical protein [uncultured Desulfobacterium sp.]